MPTEECDWYDTPLYYDIIFDADSAREAEFLEAVHRCHGGTPGRRLLEPACGSGRLVVEMARRGWKVSGFDGSERMLKFARERLKDQGLKARLWHDWMQSFEAGGPGQTGSFDMAHCLVSTFKYLLTEKDAVAHLQRVAGALKKGGLYVLGIHLSDYRRQVHEHGQQQHDPEHRNLDRVAPSRQGRRTCVDRVLGRKRQQLESVRWA